MSLRRGLINLWCVVAMGCAQQANGPTEDAVATAGPAAAAATPLAADNALATEPASIAAVAEDAADGTGTSSAEPAVAAELEPVPPPTPPLETMAKVSDPAVVSPVAPAGQEFFEPAPGLIPSPVASPTSAETLDFASLVTRLRQTKAINLRTKVSVKNESDDLLEQFRAYHTQPGIVALADLRRSYDMLFHKLHSLLEDADPPLARDIDRSRAAIWELLADPSKFGASLLAGA